MACPVQDFNWKSLFGSKIVKHSLSSLIFKGKFYFFEYCVGLLHHNNGYHLDITSKATSHVCMGSMFTIQKVAVSFSVPLSLLLH